jgi:uncharacterized paraquat-inducible protein A
MVVKTVLGKIDSMKRIRVFGDFLMLGTFLLLVWLFFSAYLSDNQSATVKINNYGEADIEMIILVFFLLPLSLLTVTLSLLDWKQTWKARGKILSQHYLLLNAPDSHQSQTCFFTCPRCSIRFGAYGINEGAVITCPSCKLKGPYKPNNIDLDHNMHMKPNVKIIKKIRP